MMKSLKPIYFALIFFLFISINVYSQETLMYLQGYEELYLPPSENGGVIDTIYDRYMLFNPTDLEKVDSLVFLYYGERSVIYNSSITPSLREGKSLIQAGKALATNDYSLIAYIKMGITNPFNFQEEGLGIIVRKPVVSVSDTIDIEEGLIEEP